MYGRAHQTRRHHGPAGRRDRRRPPSAGTILGSIRQQLTADAWVARVADGLAARSERLYPAALTGTWTPAELDELVAFLRDVPALAGLSGVAAVVEPAVVALGTPVRSTMGQRLFRLDALVEPSGVAGGAVLADGAHRDTVRRWIREFMIEADDFARDDSAQFADLVVDGGRAWLWIDSDGVPLSLAARRDVVHGSARVGPVYTPPEARGRGYGSAVTAAATRSILDDGAIPVLFTDLANPTSNKIYQLLGYHPVEDRVVMSFR